mgnify:CR=1 FL=1
MTKEKATTREKLLACAIIIAFMSLNIVLGSFFSPRSWSPAVVTAAASYLIIFIVVAAAAGIRFLYRDWKTPPRHALDHPATTLPANLAGPTPTPARAQAASRERPAPPTPPGDFATIDGAISYAQQSGFSIINLFTEHTPLNDFREAVGAEIIYLVLSHIAEIDKNASLTVTGSATEEALTLTISALTDRAPVLGARHMGEIRALATSVGGSVDTDTQAASWTLTASLPAAADAHS